MKTELAERTQESSKEFKEQFDKTWLKEDAEKHSQKVEADMSALKATLEAVQRQLTALSGQQTEIQEKLSQPPAPAEPSGDYEEG